MSTEGFGKIPPQAVELEEAILGALLLERDAMALVSDKLKPQHFYDERHKLIAESIWSLYGQSLAVDLLTVSEHLRQRGLIERAGGAYYVTEITNRIASSAHIEHHAHIVIQAYFKRQIITISSEAIQRGYDNSTDCFDLMDWVHQEFVKTGEILSKKEPRSIGAIAADTISRIEQIDSTKSVTGIPSSLQCLNDKLKGYQETDLIILAARPGMGKTSLGLQEAISAAKNGSKCLFFSLEMGEEQLAQRIMSLESEVELSKIKHNRLQSEDWAKINQSMGDYIDSNLYIDDTAGITVFELGVKARKIKNKLGDIDMIFIDYIQLISGNEDKSENARMEIISRQLKILAKDLKIPILAFSQLSRACELRADKRPQLSDLRSSGAIEQDADIVMFLYRPGYYDTNNEYESDEIIVAKHRNGSPGTCKAFFHGELVKFKDVDGNDYFSNSPMPTTTDAPVF